MTTAVATIHAQGSDPSTVARPAFAVPSVARTTISSGPASGLATLEGTLPGWLRGKLMRTAPALFQKGAWHAEHWFDGLGMVYAFGIESPDRVTWGQRLLASHVASEAETGRMGIATFGSPIQRSFWRRLVEPIPRITDNANVNVVKLGSEWVAMTESPHQLSVDEDTLTTSGRVAYEDDLPRGLFMIAHPHFDHERRRVVGLGTVFGRQGQIIAYEHEPAKRSRREIARFTADELPYVHSFGLTADDVIVVGHPWVVRPMSLLWSNKALADHFEWRQDQGTDLVVLGRDGGGGSSNRGVTKYQVESMFVFHTVNAFRDGDSRVLDVLAYPDSGIIGALATEPLASGFPKLRPALRRIRMNPSGKATVETLVATGFEFPAINYRKVSGRRHRYVWGSTASADGQDIVKVDCDGGAVESWGVPGVLFGEPVFVPRPASQEEDDGVLLSVGSSAGRAMLAVIDAKRMETLALAHIEAPLPLGFHGSFSRSA